MDMSVATRRNDYFLIATYAARAAFLEAGKYRAMAYPAFCQQLVRRQAADGSWHFSPPGGDRPMADTALVLTALQLPYRRLATLTPHRPADAAALGNPATRPVSRPAGGP